MADLNGAPAESGGEDLHAALEQAFDSAASGEVTTQEAAAPVDLKAEESPFRERARDETGRFAKAEEKKDEQSESEGAVTTEPTDQQAEAEPEKAPIEAPILAPVSWSADEKAEFAKLPPAAQKIIARRESERDKAIQQKAREAAEVQKRYDAIEQVIGPRRQEMAIHGQNEAQVLSHLFALHDYAQKDPAGYIAWAAKQLGVDLAQQAAPQEPEFQDPQLKHLHDRLSRFEQTEAQRLAHEQRMAAEHRQRAQLAAAQAHQMTKTEIESFAAETDASGTQLRPYFDRLMDDILPIAASIRKSSPSLPVKDVLAQAYNKAVWANDETRAAQMELTRRQEEAKRNEEAKKKAANAVRASASVVGSPGGSVVSAPKATLREELEAAFGGR